jgi:hypothetical protein
MKKLLMGVVAALSLVSAVAVAPVMAAPPVDEVETALAEIVGTLGIMLPMEEAILYGLAVMIVYLWAAIGYFVGAAFVVAPILGLLLIYGALFTETFAEYAVVFNNAWLMLPGAHAIPAVVNALIALGGEFILPILLWMGNFLIDFAAALEPLQEYFPPPF